MTVMESFAPARGSSISPRAHRAVWRVPLLDLGAALLGVAVATALDLGTGGALLATTAPALWVAAMYSQGAYGASAVGSDRVEQLHAVARAATLTAASVLVIEATLGPPGKPAAWLVILAVAATGALAHRRLGDAVGARAGAVRVLAVGSAEHLGGALHEMLQGTPRQVHVVSVRSYDGGHVDVSDVADAVVRHGAEAVVVVPPVDPLELRRLSWRLSASGTQLYVTTPLADVSPSRTRLTGWGRLGILQVRPAGRPVARVVKGAAERLLALLLLLVAAPVLLALLLAVRLDSPGPAIFRQQRVGRGGRPFTMFKVRTMCAEAERIKAQLAADNDSDRVLFKMRQDPRITSVGKVLRRFSLDELPQLLNVVCGHMALVGPRPALPEEVAQYDLDPTRRLVVKPGVTGLWQVSGRSDLSWEESVRLDVSYVDNWSLMLDASILARTLSAVLRRRGAY